MKKKIESLKCLLFVLILCTNCVYAERDRAHPTPITSFKDDRNAELVNTNFKELEGFAIDKSSYNAVINSAATISTVAFVVPMQDVDYGVFVTPSWTANVRVLQKTTTGFLIQYDAPGTPGQILDWIVTR